MIDTKKTRKLILDIISKGKAAHIASCFSAVDILHAVYSSVDLGKIRDQAEDRDRVILSKGHAAASLYVTLFQFGFMKEAELMTYHSDDSVLCGHVSHCVPGVEHSTGALGHGLPVALGMAIGLKARKLSSRVFVIVGDGELHEGSNWEAIMLAGFRQLNNLCVLVDQNRLCQIGDIDKCCSLDSLKAKFESFRFETYEVDEHNAKLIYQTISSSKKSTKPVAIICQTTKGKGVSYMEGNNLWHYRTPTGRDYEQATTELLTFSILKHQWKVIYSGLFHSRKKVNTGFSNFFVETNTAFHKFDLEKACIWSTFDPLLEKRPIKA